MDLESPTAQRVHETGADMTLDQSIEHIVHLAHTAATPQAFVKGVVAAIGTALSSPFAANGLFAATNAWMLDVN